MSWNKKRLTSLAPSQTWIHVGGRAIITNCLSTQFRNAKEIHHFRSVLRIEGLGTTSVRKQAATVEVHRENLKQWSSTAASKDNIIFHFPLYFGCG